MSQENVEIVRGMVTRFAAGDRESWREVFAEDAVWDTSATTTPQAGVYEGHAGMERFFIDWLGTWVNPVVESLELTDSVPASSFTDRLSLRGLYALAPRPG